MRVRTWAASLSGLSRRRRGEESGAGAATVMAKHRGRLKFRHNPPLTKH